MLGEYVFPRQILLGIKKRVEMMPTAAPVDAQSER